VSGPLSAAEAAERILLDVRRQPPLRIPLDDALDSVVAEDIVSPLDIPPWTNSAMDGYAARGEDVRGASEHHPVRLRVVEQLPAGHFPSRTIGPGECARIFTGAPLPQGSDSVIRQEDTDGGVQTVTVLKDRDVGVNIRRAGEDIRRGSTVLARGTLLEPAHLGVLASLAVAHPLVYRRPRVAILGSGDEVVDVDQPEEILAGRKIASSNTHTLVALVRQAGGEPVNLGIARDTPESLRQHMAAARDCDLLVTTAGISVGEHDYIRSVLDELGAEQRFWKLRMRPGAPVGFGILGEIPWIGLPGNPVSTMVTFELFVRPALLAMQGRRRLDRPRVQAVAAGTTTNHGSRRGYLRVSLEAREGRWHARLTGDQGSGILRSMVQADGLAVLPGDTTVEAGDDVEVIVIRDLSR
jgi:molybdopterin molybdotransferase